MNGSHAGLIVIYYKRRESRAYEGIGTVPDRGEALIAWDDEDDPEGNVQHIAKHGLAMEEIESVLLETGNVEGMSRSSGRPIVFGWTSTGRFIAIVYEWCSESPPVIYPITAYEVEF